jgi:hypothetical protein
MPRLDVFLGNAGVTGFKWHRPGKHKRMIAVNIISTIYLDILMLPNLKGLCKGVLEPAPSGDRIERRPHNDGVPQVEATKHI